MAHSDSRDPVQGELSPDAFRKDVSAERASTWKGYRLEPGDVLFTEGGDWDKVGRSAVWHGQLDPCIHQNHVFRARLVTPLLNPTWFSLFANTRVGRRYFENAAKQTTNLASINMTQLRNCPVPVPPTKEAQIILAKVDMLMKVCDHLDDRLRQAENCGTRLVEAAVRDLVRCEASGEASGV